MTGLFMTTFNCVEKTKEAARSLRDNTLVPFELVLIDNHSTDETDEWAKANDIVVIKDDVGDNLASALNQGIRYFCDKDVEYIGWIHNDMIFYSGWLKCLTQFQKDTGILGKFSLANANHYGVPEAECLHRMDTALSKKNDDGSDRAWQYHEGNECPWICTVNVFNDWEVFFDVGYVGIGGYEDWDLNRRIMGKGGKVIIVDDAWLWHEGMGTRKNLTQQEEAIQNSKYYHKKWGTSEPLV